MGVNADLIINAMYYIVDPISPSKENHVCMYLWVIKEPSSSSLRNSTVRKQYKK